MVWPAELGEGVGLRPSVVFDDTEAGCELEPSEACGEATEGSQGMMDNPALALTLSAIVGASIGGLILEFMGVIP
jgi:hypothetical protein